MTKEELVSYYQITEYDDKVIDLVESLVRNSRLYKKYCGMIREEFYQIDDLFRGYNQENLEKQVHHVLHLQSICKAVYIKQLLELDAKGYTTVYQLVDEVLNLHAENMLPTCLLSVTTHNLVHDNQYVVPKEEINFGEHTKFLENYGKYFNIETLRNVYVKYGIITEKQLSDYSKTETMEETNYGQNTEDRPE